MKRGVEVKGDLVSVEEVQDESSESEEEFDEDDESLEDEEGVGEVAVREEELSQNPGINRKNGEIRLNATKPKAKDSDSLQFANEI